MIERWQLRRTWLVAACLLPAVGAAPVDWLPLNCTAHKTVGLHDMPGYEESYEEVVFVEGSFRLRENSLFMTHLTGDEEDATLFVTMERKDGESEFSCRPVRGGDDNEGFSCVNNPPSEMLLINPANNRFTRSAIGGWTFYTETHASDGASLFVEYGECQRRVRGAR